MESARKALCCLSSFLLLSFCHIWNVYWLALFQICQNIVLRFKRIQSLQECHILDLYKQPNTNQTFGCFL